MVPMVFGTKYYLPYCLKLWLRYISKEREESCYKSKGTQACNEN